MLFGIELPNRPDGTVTDDEWAKLEKLRPSSVKVRPYHLNQGTVDRAVEIMKRFGESHLLIRQDEDGQDVSTAYNGIHNVLQRCTELDVSATVEIDNEPNNRDLRPNDWYHDTAIPMIDRLNEIWPWIPRVSPGLAVLKDEEPWNLRIDMAPKFSLRGVHVYWEGEAGWQSPEFVERPFAPFLSSKQRVATEIGDSSWTDGWDAKLPRYQAMLRRLAAFDYTGAYLFILGGSDDWANFFPSHEVCEALGSEFGVG
jgi:hypothetical protein